MRSPTIVVPRREERGRRSRLREWWAHLDHREVISAVLWVAVLVAGLGTAWYWVNRADRSGSSVSTIAMGSGPPPAVAEFRESQDSLAAGIERYRERRQEMESGLSACPPLVSAYGYVDSLFVQVASRHQSLEERLPPSQRERYRTLFDRMTEVNRTFDESGCPRPQ